MSHPAPSDPHEFEVARAVLTDIEYLTWAMQERGVSRDDIASYRRVSKGTVNACLKEARRKIEAAMRDEEAA